MGKGARENKGSAAVRFLLTQGPIVALLIVLAVLCLGTFGNYVASDDLGWVTRTISDSTRPLHIFSASDPLFGNYYRPMAHLAWLINYYLWGFNFDGHQAMFLILWLAVVWLVYEAGVRIAGRTAGFIAAALVGFNNIYLMMSGWKSWYTSLVELAAVLAWALFYLDWLKGRTRGKLIGWIVCAVVAVLSRELAPLVISAVILVTLVLPALFGSEGDSGKRKMALAAAWVILTGGVLAALPSYRDSLAALLHGGGGAAGGPSWGNVAGHFRTHSGSMLFSGISRYLLYLAALLPALECLRRWAGRMKPRREQMALLGAVVIGSVLLALPANAKVFGPQAQETVELFVLPLMCGLLLTFVIFSAFSGDRNDRMLGAWFLAAFPPILFLQHGSNAYHMMAFIALALFTGKQIAALLRECWRGLVARKAPKEGRESWYALSAILALILVGQGVILVRGVEAAREKIRGDVRMGRAVREQVDRTVAVAALSVRERKVLVAGDPYSLLAGQMLKANYGFKVGLLEQQGSLMVGLRLFDAPLGVYSYAIAYDDALFQHYNHPLLRPDPSFETLPVRGPVVEGGRTGQHAMAIMTQGTAPGAAQLPSSEFSLPPGPYVFGGFVRIEAEAARSVTMSLVEQGAGGAETLIRATPQAAQTQPQWELLWENAATQQEGRFTFNILDVEGLKNGRVLVDDVFICPVAALIGESRRRAAETTRARRAAAMEMRGRE